MLLDSAFEMSAGLSYVRRLAVGAGDPVHDVTGVELRAVVFGSNKSGA